VQEEGHKESQADQHHEQQRQPEGACGIHLTDSRGQLLPGQSEASGPICICLRTGAFGW